MKIIASIPTGRPEISIHTANSCLALKQSAPNMSWSFHDGCSVQRNRHSMIEQAIIGEFDFLLMIDSDMVFTVEDISTLLEVLEDESKVAIVGALAMRRLTDEISYNVGWIDKSSDTGWLDNEKTLKKSERLIKEGVPAKADTIGTGICMLRVKALSELDKPYCIESWNPSNEWTGSDSDLCKNLRSKGWKTLMHFGVLVGHVSSVVYMPVK